jgi:endonuclease/exonuclease/phosphatase (EEP) superfamily protein YafD
LIGRRVWIWAAVGHLAAVLGLWVAFRLAGDRWAWAALLFYAPRALYALPLLAISPALFASGARRWLWLQAATALLVAGPLMGLHLGAPSPARGPVVRLLTCNVWFGAGDLPVLRQELIAARPDVVVFQAAAHPADVFLKQPPFDTFNYLHEDQFAVASRWPVRVTQRGTLLSSRLHRPWVSFAVDTPLGTLELISVHPHSPRVLFEKRALKQLVFSGPAGDPGGALGLLDEHLTEIANAAKAGGPLVVLAGDFNVPDGGSLMPALFNGLGDAFVETGRGYGYTFPVNGRRSPWLRLDRVLHGPGLRAVSASLDTRPGADHAALLVELTSAN